MLSQVSSWSCDGCEVPLGFTFRSVCIMLLYMYMVGLCAMCVCDSAEGMI